MYNRKQIFEGAENKFYLFDVDIVNSLLNREKIDCVGQNISAKFEIVTQTVAQLPWGHQRLLISKIKDVDLALILKHISEFMIELGKRFAFVGKQDNIVVNDNDYYAYC